MKNQTTSIFGQSSRLLLFATFLIGLGLLSGCGSMPNETWYCYDQNGKPVEGVLIVCRYGLANYKVRAVGYRFSDAQGKVYFDRDGGSIPGDLMRGYVCVYSPSLRNGDAGLGERWHEGNPVPSVSVYFDEWKNKIYIRDATKNPVSWNYALNTLIRVCGNVKQRDYAMYGPGIEKLEAAILPIAQRERELFLKQYGDTLVSAADIKNGNLDVFFRQFSNKERSGLRFRDITLQMP